MQVSWFLEKSADSFYSTGAQPLKLGDELTPLSVTAHGDPVRFPLRYILVCHHLAATSVGFLKEPPPRFLPHDIPLATQSLQGSC